MNDTVLELEVITTAQDMPTFSIMCLDSSDMPPSEDLDSLLSLENLWLPELSIKVENVGSWCTVDRGEMARATGLEIEMHEAAKWRCSNEDKMRAAALAAGIISNHKAKAEYMED